MTYDELIMKEIKARGKDPSDLSPAEFAEISLKVRSPEERAKAVMEASASFIKTRIFTVPLPIYWQRREACEANTCGKLVHLKGEKAACLSCGCGGALLEDVKWWDAAKECPLKVWSKYVPQPA